MFLKGGAKEAFCHSLKSFCSMMNLHLVSSCTQQSIELLPPLYFEHLDLPNKFIKIRTKSKFLIISTQSLLLIKLTTTSACYPTVYDTSIPYANNTLTTMILVSSITNHKFNNAKYTVNRERFTGLNICGFSLMKFFMGIHTFMVPWPAVYII